MFWAIVIFGGVLLIGLGFQPFMQGFQEKFGRSFIHRGDIALILLLLLSMGCMWTTVMYLTMVVIIGMGIWHMVKYGFLWGLGVWFYNILIVALVISVINTILNVMKNNKK